MMDSRALEADVERYRRATEDALQQLDWCIGYFHGCGKRGIAKALSEQPVPTQHISSSDE